MEELITKIINLDDEVSKYVSQDCFLMNCNNNKVNEIIPQIKLLYEYINKALKRKEYHVHYYKLLNEIIYKWKAYISYHNGFIDEPHFIPDKSKEPIERLKILQRNSGKYKNYLIGYVVKISGKKSVTILTNRIIEHKLYGRLYKDEKKYMIHDENEICKVGDIIIAVECRPISKKKHFRVFDKVFSVSNNIREPQI